MKNKTIVNLDNVSFAFNEKKLFDRVKLDITEGEIFMIVGASGSGLSTFLRLLSGLLDPLEGTVKIFDVDIGNATQQQMVAIRQMTGYVFQRSGLINNMTLLDNIALPLRYHTALKEKEILAIARDKLRFAGIEGYETKLPAQLSEECKKRGGFARALAMDPGLIFYDELTTDLCEFSPHSILSLIEKLKEEKGTTSVITSHNKNFADTKADRVAVIQGERIEII